MKFHLCALCVAIVVTPSLKSIVGFVSSKSSQDQQVEFPFKNVVNGEVGQTFSRNSRLLHASADRVLPPTLGPLSLLHSNPTVAPSLVSFLGKSLTFSHFSAIQSLLNCYTSEGSWEFDVRRYSFFNSSLPYEEAFQEISPCVIFKCPKGDEFDHYGCNSCKHQLKGKNIFYYWKVNETACSRSYDVLFTHSSGKTESPMIELSQVQEKGNSALSSDNYHHAVDLHIANETTGTLTAQHHHRHHSHRHHSENVSLTEDEIDEEGNNEHEASQVASSASSVSSNSTHSHFSLLSVFKRFSVKRLCHLFHQLHLFREFQGRNTSTILFVGDSISEEMYFSMQNLVLFSLYGKDGFNIGHSKCSVEPFEIMCPSHHSVSSSSSSSSSPSSPSSRSSSPNSIVLRRIRNDQLTLMESSTELQESFVSFLNASSLQYDPAISLIIINRGIHFEPNTTKLLLELNETFSFLRNHYPHISILWRNTIFGTYDSVQKFFVSPPLKKEEFIEEIEFAKPHKKQPYHYEHITEQNKEVEKFLKLKFPEILQLDVLSSIKLRKDSHVDYLHYCVPGPIDSWIDFLTVTLQMLLI
jgi:hypothetical protein